MNWKRAGDIALEAATFCGLAGAVGTLGVLLYDPSLMQADEDDWVTFFALSPFLASGILIVFALMAWVVGED